MSGGVLRRGTPACESEKAKQQSQFIVKYKSMKHKEIIFVFIYNL